MFGKVKSVTPNVANGQDCIEPTPNYDTHISIIKPHPEMGVWHAQDHSMVSHPRNKYTISHRYIVHVIKLSNMLDNVNYFQTIISFLLPHPF